jgi:hypothetical protein
LEDKIGFGDAKPLLINQEGAFFIPKRGEVGKMDMESDMSDGDMDMAGIFRPRTIKHPPLDCLENRKRPRKGRPG